MTALIVTDETTRAEIAEAITNLRATVQRMPAHWLERRGAIHGQINDLLDAWELAS